MSTARELLEELAERGVKVRVDGADVVLRGPRPVLEQELPRVREHKPELLELLRPNVATARVFGSSTKEWSWYCPPADPPAAGTGRPVDQAALDVVRSGRAVRVWSAVLGEWLYWVRDEAERARLLERGCTGPIYTLGELVIVAEGTGEDVRNLHSLKREFNAVIQHLEETL